MGRYVYAYLVMLPIALALFLMLDPALYPAVAGLGYFIVWWRIRK